MKDQWKKEFIFNYIDRFNNNFTRLIYPQMLEIQLTDACNLHCSFCNSIFYSNRKNPKQLDVSILIQFIKSIPDLKAVTIEGGGEPTLYPYLKEIIEFLYNNNIKVGIITNGIIKINDNLCKKLSYIRISLDAFDKKTFYKVKGTDYFDTVINNIKYYSEYRDNLILGISYVATKHNLNINEIHNLYNRIENYIDYLQIKPEENSLHLLSILNTINTKNNKIYVIDCTKNENKIEYDKVCKKCYTNQLTSTIRSNGDVLFCKRMKNPIVIGNINNSAENIYINNIQKQEVINKVMDKKGFNDLCQLPCRLKKYNYIINEMLSYNEKTKYFL